MRRALGYGLLVLGLALVFAAPLFRWYVVPRVEKLPTDLYEVSRTDGSGRYFDPRTLSLTGVRPLETISITKGIPERSDHRVAVVSLFSRTVDLVSHQDIDYSQDVYVVDRRTGEPVHCCGEHPRHQGLLIKFPFGVRKDGAYSWWDGTAGRAYPARYDGTTTIDRVHTFVYRVHVPDVRIGTVQVPASLVGRGGTGNVTAFEHYTGESTVWVEPQTGAVLNVRQLTQEWFADADGTHLLTLAATDFVQSPASIRDAVDQLSGQLWQLRLFRAVPLLAPLLGVLALAGSGLLLRARSRGAVEAQSELRPALA